VGQLLSAVVDEAPVAEAPAGRAPWIGQGLCRVEDARLVTGAGRFVDDHQPAGCLHVAFLRSPHARATIVALDTTAARAAPGVALVATGRDVAALAAPAVNRIVAGMQIPPCPILALDEVSAVGEAIAAVVADSLEAARDAAELIALELAPRDALTEVTAAAHAPPAVPGQAQNTVFTQRWATGETGAAFATAATTVSVRLAQPLLAAVSLEPRAILADGSGGVLSVQLSTQTPHRARAELARILEIDEATVRVVARDVGGAFGAKASLYPEDILVAWAALRLARPVKWISTRAEDMLAATHGRGAALDGTLAVDADGRILALRAAITAPLGRWLTHSAAVPAWNAGRILPGPYRAPAVDIAIAGVATNTTAVGIYRGAGRPEAALLMERLIDEAARALDLDPVEVRRRNILASLPARTPTGQVIDSGDFAALIDDASGAADYAALRRDQARRRTQGELVGIGVALYVEPCGSGWESARVMITRDGTVTVATGAAAQGQGRETAFAQIAADALDVDVGAVRVVCSDTSAIATGVGALASRSTAIGGSAVLRAAEAVRDAGWRVAAELLQATVDEIVAIPDGLGLRRDPGRRVSWPTIADANGGTIAASETFTSDETWASGCCIAAVAIDRDTGCLRIERLVWADDAGVVVNPLLAEGQMVGGLAQGLGQATMERLAHDEAGQLLTGSLMDYAVPRARDMPPVALVKRATRATTNPLGAKGVGEAGCVGVPAAILNAALDALAPLGVRHLDMPLTSESLWRAMRDAGNEVRP
jgi:carbon-monoxide dehydrogenase large subunit